MAEGAAGEEADRESGRCRRRAGKRLNKISDKMADSADTQKKSDFPAGLLISRTCGSGNGLHFI